MVQQFSRMRLSKTILIDLGKKKKKEQLVIIALKLSLKTNQPETDTWHGLLRILDPPMLQRWKLEFGRYIACVSQMGSCTWF